MNADRIKELADAALAIAISGHAEIAALRDAALERADLDQQWRAMMARIAEQAVDVAPLRIALAAMEGWLDQPETTQAYDEKLACLLSAIEVARSAIAAVPVAAQEPTTDELRAMLNKTESPWLHYELSKQIAAPAAQEPAQPVAWFIDTHGVQSVAIRKEDLGLLAERYAVPLYAASPAPAAPDVVKDAERYRWLRDRFLGADFDWGSCDEDGTQGTQVLLIKFDGPSVWGCLDLTVDAAIAASGANQGEGHAHR